MYKTYINKLILPTDHDENMFISQLKRYCYGSVYPYKIFPMKDLLEIELAPVTIFYGGNGSGKSTLLNIIAEKTEVIRHSAFGQSPFFDNYVGSCCIKGKEIPEHSQILTSDDVSDYILNVRYLNDGIDIRREELIREYVERKYKKHEIIDIANYHDWKDDYDAKSKSESRFVKERLMRNADMHSNGETALKYFVEHISENALYLLDEPENSLSIELQQELCEYISASARHFGCQFIMASHSPVILSIKDAVIYDLDSTPVCRKKWTELENVRRYFDFFEQHHQEFI